LPNTIVIHNEARMRMWHRGLFFFQTVLLKFLINLQNPYKAVIPDQNGCPPHTNITFSMCFSFSMFHYFNACYSFFQLWILFMTQNPLLSIHTSTKLAYQVSKPINLFQIRSIFIGNFEIFNQRAISHIISGSEVEVHRSRESQWFLVP
jgi:hypothetical protein